MIIGIVGSEQAKWTPESEAICRSHIRKLILDLEPEAVCSGECHLGGVDIFAREEAKNLGIPFIGFPPKNLTWSTGFMPRNKEIAETSDEVACFTVRKLPDGFKEGGWERYCYHCKTDEHIKSGGCWTTKYARSIGKKGYTVVI